MDDYFQQFIAPATIARISERTGHAPAETRAMLATYEAEARFGFSLIEPHLREGARILEVGSGLGILASYLREKGFDITPLEPCARGFDMFSAVLEALVEMGVVAAPLAVSAEQLSPNRHGTFDFIYSVNVLEHISDLEGALASIVSVLAPAGRMLHTCPNYTVPYEPHFSVPLVPGAPRLTARMLPERIAGTPLWHSLNFITVRRLRRILDDLGCRAEFRTGLLAEALRRLSDDAVFANRHHAVVRTAARTMRRTGMLRLLEHLPAGLSTPLVVDVARAGVDATAPI